MAYESDFNEMLPHSITRKAYSSLNLYGENSFSTGAGTTYSARISYKPKLIRAIDGNEKVSSANAIVASTGTLNTDDKYTLPDGTTPQVLSIDYISDTGGQHHARIYFG